LKLVLITLGSHGDVHPFIAIGNALQRRGHTPLLATNPYYRPQIEAAGVPFAALGEREDLKTVITNHKVMHPTWGPIVVLRKLILPMVASGVQRTRELIREHRPDVVVYHPIVMGVPWACELEGGVPTVSIAPSPLIWANPNDQIVLFAARSARPSRLAVRFDQFVSTWFLRLALDPGLNRVRQALGLPAQRDNFHRGAVGADLNLGIWSSVLRATVAGDPANSAVTGFTWHDRDHTQETPDAELLAFLNAGPAPIVFALGSTGVHAAGRFYHNAVEACTRLGMRALLVVGRDQPPPVNLPSNGSMKAVAYAPYSVVFPRASVIVHHGGAGTTAQALRAGRPTLITPMAHDQFDYAARVQRLGTGETLRFSSVTATRLIRALHVLLTHGEFAQRAEGLAGPVAAVDGAARSATLIHDRFSARSTRAMPSWTA